MISHEQNGIKYYKFGTLGFSGVTQAVFTRQGGFSQVPWNSLNLGGTVGDNPDHVERNLKLLLKTLGCGPGQLVQVRQISSANVILVNEPMDAIYQADAMITNTPGLLMLMRFADCVPILFVDPTKNAVGIAHAGWRGTVEQVSYHAVCAMENNFGTNPSDLFAAIGPSIGPCHYEVGADVIERVKDTFADNSNEILIKDKDAVKLDLWKANTISLRKAGVEKIEISEICTGCNTEEWYSHRKEGRKTGRFAAVIGLI